MASRGFDPALDTKLECTHAAPSDARRAVGCLAPAVDAGLVRDVQLLVSELVTNSVRHSGCDEPIRLRVWVRSGSLKVEIADGGNGFDRSPGAAGENAEGGRGLLILNALAERWGVTRGTGAHVWFELAARPVGSAAQAG